MAGAKAEQMADAGPNAPGGDAPVGRQSVAIGVRPVSRGRGAHATPEAGKETQA